LLNWSVVSSTIKRRSALDCSRETIACLINRACAGLSTTNRCSRVSWSRFADIMDHSVASNSTGFRAR
jgi:hypothetical protein